MFVHLRLHTEFSVVDGTNRIDEVVKAAAADRQPALAITDLNNLFGAVKFYKEGARQGRQAGAWARKSSCEGLGDEPGALTRIVLLVQNKEGYLHLSELLARAWTQNVGRGQAQAACKLAWLEELQGGLIALSGAQAGPLGAGAAAGPGRARRRGCALQLAGLFPHRFYIELQRAGRPDDEPHVIAAVQAGGAAQAAGGGHASGAVRRPPTTTRRTRRASASPRARSWATRAACASSRASSISSRRPRWRRCSPTCRARWPTRSRSPSAAT